MRRLLAWALISIVVKLIVNHLAWAGLDFFKSAGAVLVNTLIFISCGFVIIFLNDDKGERPSLFFVVLLHLAVYCSPYVADYYYEWPHQIAKAENISAQSAALQRDVFLQDQVHQPGFEGYLVMVARRPARPVNPDDAPDDLLDLILWGIPKLLQWGARSAGLRIDGVIDFVYWYLVAGLVTVITAAWLD